MAKKYMKIFSGSLGKCIYENTVGYCSIPPVLLVRMQNGLVSLENSWGALQI